MTTEQRIQTEQDIFTKLVDDALAQGNTISVFDSDTWVVHGSRNRTRILCAMHTMNEDKLKFRDIRNGDVLGQVFLVYGKHGWDVIKDYTDNARMGVIMNGAEQLAKTLREKYNE